MSHRLTVHRSRSTNQLQSPSNLRNYITVKSEIFILSSCSRKASDHLFAMRGAVCVHAELPLTSAINMQKKIHWLPNISQAARVFVSHTISSLYQTTLTSKETRLCLSEEENLWMPSWRRSYLCNMTLQLVPISPAQRVFSTGYPCSKLCITFKITGFVKEKNNCFCSLRM